MNADEVRAWLVAQIDADERVAQEAGGGRWRWDHGYGAMCNDKGCPYGELVSEDGAAGAVLMDVHGYDVHEGWQGAAHIVRHDPARVLREVEAKRRRLERHRPVEVWAGHDHLPPGDPGARQLLWVNCARCIEDSGDSGAYDCQHANLRWPCPDIVDDAQAYADRPGFPAELRLP